MYLPLFVGVLCLSVWYALLCVHSGFAIILKRKRKRVTLLLLSYRCIVSVNYLWRLFLAVPWVGLQCVIVVFPDHTHLLSYTVFLRHLLEKIMDTMCTQHVGYSIGATLEMNRKCHNHTGRVARKPVFGVSDKASFKQVSSATETT